MARSEQNVPHGIVRSPPDRTVIAGVEASAPAADDAQHIVFGYRAAVSPGYFNQISIGTDSLSNGDGNVVVGQLAEGRGGGDSVSIGKTAIVQRFGGVAIGSGANAAQQYGICLGPGAVSTRPGTDARSVVIGYNANSNQSDSVCIGPSAAITSGGGGDNSVAIGRAATVTTGPAVAVGEGTVAAAAGCVALGPSANASSPNSIAVGKGSTAAGGGIKIGEGAAGGVSPSGGIAIGHLSIAEAANRIAIGRDAVAAADQCVIGSPTAGYVLTSFKVQSPAGKLFDHVVGTGMDLGTAAETYRINGTQVVKSRVAGWTAATGTKARTTFDADAATTAQVAARLAALLDDMLSHGLIGA